MERSQFERQALGKQPYRIIISREELRTEAKRKGIGPTTLVRMWVIERLRSKEARASR